MKKIIKFLSFFILNSQKRKEFRKKYDFSYYNLAIFKNRYKIEGKNNKIIIVKDEKEHVLSKFLKIKGLNIELKGDNNLVKIEFLTPCFNNCRIKILGKNNTISIKKTNFYIKNLNITSSDGHNRSVLIDEDFSSERLHIYIDDNDSSVIIGKDCMFSHDLFFRNSDGHCILDKNGQVLNKGKDIIIGNHVWIGAFTKVLKNTIIPDGCIVGCGSIVNKKFTEVNTVIAGNPAKIVKKDISWIRENFNNYSERMINETTA